MKKTILSCILFIFLQPILSYGDEPLRFKKEEASIVILGGGVGALTSALYLSRAGLHPIVIEGPQPGGLITQSHLVQNWPGEMEISGHELVEKMRKQAEANGAQFYREEVTKVDFSKHPLQIFTRSIDNEEEGHIFRADSTIIAMGSKPNHLGIPGETGDQGYWGRGVTNCAICDGPVFRGKNVGVVGGGDAAILEALYLADIAKEVHVFVRKGALGGVEGKRLNALLAKPNIKVLYNTTVEEIKGDGTKVTGVVLKTAQKSSYDFSLDGLFLAIGSTPNTEIFRKELEIDPQGYIALKNDQQTSVAGVYAIGDIVDPKYKQAISAAGDGAKAALQAQNFISERADKIPEKKEEKPLCAVSKFEVIEVTSVEQFERELKSSNMPIFVDFYASWCGPCKQISPRIEKSAEHLAGRIKFLKVNVDRLDRLSGRYDIRGMPTVLLFQPNGKITERKVGFDQITALLKKLEKSEPRF